LVRLLCRAPPRLRVAFRFGPCASRVVVELLFARARRAVTALSGIYLVSADCWEASFFNQHLLCSHGSLICQHSYRLINYAVLTAHQLN
jgi:hypothetical protein